VLQKLDAGVLQETRSKLELHRIILLGKSFRGCFRRPREFIVGSSQDLLVLVAAAKLRGLNGVEIPPPGVAVAAPLRIQCRHSNEGAPERRPSDHEALTETVEKRNGGSAAKSFAYQSHMQFDDLPPKRAVEV